MTGSSGLRDWGAAPGVPLLLGSPRGLSLRMRSKRGLNLQGARRAQRDPPGIGGRRLGLPPALLGRFFTSWPPLLL